MNNSFHSHHEIRSIARRAVTTLFGSIWIGLTLLLASSVWGQLSDDSSLPIQERRDITLQWLDRYLTESELLRKSDMDQIRAAVERMAPSQLEQWLAQTKDLRAYVESEKWQDTKTWLRGFLRVQAMYSDAQVQKLRNDLINADATQMLTILKRIQAKHDALVWMHEASEKSRQLAVLQRDESVAAQEAAAAAARAAGAENVATAGGAQADTSRAGRNKAGYQAPGALINARDMSRASVWAQVWGPTWYIGGF
jgi:alanyl-tRNA synthetase